MAVEHTLQERGKRYGEYREHARITQNIKRAMIDSPNWWNLRDDQRETLEMIAHKIGRALNGDPQFADTWHDIAGYATLTEKEIHADSERSEGGTAEIEGPQPRHDRHPQGKGSRGKRVAVRRRKARA